MGRILRLRDTKGTGQADEVKEFVAEVDSPRGLVWDKDRLYLVHPPHLSVYIDKDGDGIADEEKVLVKNLAFTFKDRPADHTTNGLSIGVPESRIMPQKALEDGWLASPARRIQSMRAMMDARTTLAFLEIKIVEALDDPEASVKKVAADAVEALKLNPEKILASRKPSGPLISTLKGEDIIRQTVATKGDRSRGEKLFTQQGCVNNVFTPWDGSVQMGFVVQEGAGKNMVSNIAGREIAISARQVSSRATDPKSLMPGGLLGNLAVKGFASLLDYLEALAKGGN